MPAQVVTVGLGKNDGRTEFVDIPFKSLGSQSELTSLEGTVVFINQEASIVQTQHPAFIIMHVPPPFRENRRTVVMKALAHRSLITTSQYAAHVWSKYIPTSLSDVSIAYPFAEPCFATQLRPRNTTETVRILFAGRLSAQKGIYTFLEMLHSDIIRRNKNLIFTVTTAGSDKPQGKIIRMLVEAHPNLRVIPARKTPAEMAELMSKQDIVVMPSNSQYWHETFGIVSVEAQHSGCWVVASDDGGLPETDCGGIILVEPDNPEALAQGVKAAIANGALPDDTRDKAASMFTVEQSVDNLLKVLFPAEELVVQPVEEVVLRSSIKGPYPIE